MKTNKSTASKSTELTDAPESKVSTPNPDFIMKSDNSTTPVNPVNTVNSDNAVNSTSPANTDNLFDNEQTTTDTTEATARGQATAQIGLRRFQGSLSHAGKAGEASPGQHRGQRMGKARTHSSYPRRP